MKVYRVTPVIVCQTNEEAMQLCLMHGRHTVLTRSNEKAFGNNSRQAPHHFFSGGGRLKISYFAENEHSMLMNASGTFVSFNAPRILKYLP